MSRKDVLVTTMSFPLLGFFVGCTSVPPTVENDPSLEFVELQGYKFHIRTYGDKDLPPLVVIHGCPGRFQVPLSHSRPGQKPPRHLLCPVLYLMANRERVAPIVCAGEMGERRSNE